MVHQAARLSLRKRIAFHAVALAIDVVKFGLGGFALCSLVLTPRELTTSLSMVCTLLVAMTLLLLGLLLRRVDVRGGHEAIAWAALLVPWTVWHWLWFELG